MRHIERYSAPRSKSASTTEEPDTTADDPPVQTTDIVPVNQAVAIREVPREIGGTLDAGCEEASAACIGRRVICAAVKRRLKFSNAAIHRQTPSRVRQTPTPYRQTPANNVKRRTSSPNAEARRQAPQFIAKRRLLSQTDPTDAIDDACSRGVCPFQNLSRVWR